MPKITLALTDAKHLSKAMASHVGRDGVTPVLTHLHIPAPEEDGTGQYAFASDRYTAVQFDLTGMVKGDPVVGDLFIPRDALTIVNTLGKSTLLYGNRLDQYEVTFETVHESLTRGATTVKVGWRPAGEDQENTQFHWMRVFGAYGSEMKFPPIRRLITDFTAAEETNRVHLDGGYVDRFADYARWLRHPMRVTLSDKTGNRATGPVLFEVGNRFAGVMQPVNIFPNGMHSFGGDVAYDNLTKKREAEAAAKAEAGVE